MISPIQPGLWTGLDVGASVGDELDRNYTPQRLAEVIVDAIGGTPQQVLEPSVGGGAFARAVRRRWPSARLTGIDIDPGALGKKHVDEFVLGDLRDLAVEPSAFDLVVGNPPFSQAIEHVTKLIEALPERLCLILPWAYWGVDEWQPLLRGERKPAVVRPIPGRPWPDNVRETAVYEWWPRSSLAYSTRIEPLPEWR